MTPQLQKECLHLLQSLQAEVSKLQHEKNISDLKLEDAKKKIRQTIQENEEKAQELVDQFLKLHKTMSDEIKNLRAEIENK